MVLKVAAAMALSAVSAIAQTTPAGAGQQLYRTHCFVCHGEDGALVSGVNFRSGRFRRASTDEDLVRLILNGVPGTGMPPTNLTEPQRKLVVVYLRSMSGSGTATGAGDAALGKQIFEGKGGCLGCHRVGGNGSYLGPDLSDIGSVRPAARIERSILDPNESIDPRNRSIHAVTRDGAVITGRRLNEDTHTIQLIDEQGRLVSLSKSDLRELTLLKTSPMPSYRDKLSSAEIAGVVGYLLSLKGSQ
jgi:putative heme-binding domain-containing protein